MGGGTAVNSEIIFLISQQKTYFVTPHYNRLSKTTLMMCHNIRFYGAIWKIITKLSVLPHLEHCLVLMLGLC